MEEQKEEEKIETSARPRTRSIIDEVNVKSIAFEGAHRLERLVKIFKILLQQFSKSHRSAASEEERNKTANLKKDGLTILDIPELKDLFMVFSDILAKINENDISDTIKLVGITMFICFQEDFKKIEQKVFDHSFEGAHVVMQDYRDAENKQIKGFIDETYLEDERVKFLIDL
mmetsp:Transcript_32403/g.31799  ORF Transcript_32403/g.31799 Transcript_32403/m.31799 type:complete len:173 (-) Transcript_32403:246-764(-)